MSFLTHLLLGGVVGALMAVVVRRQKAGDRTLAVGLAPPGRGLIVAGQAIADPDGG